LYLIFAKTKLQHRGETFGEYPFFYYFNRTLLIIYILASVKAPDHNVKHLLQAIDITEQTA